MKSILPIIFTACFFHFQAQIPVPLTVSTYTDPTYSEIEPSGAYGFEYPVEADILTELPGSYVPSYSHRYFMSIYGPRHKEVSTSNIGFFDFHKGADITSVVEFGGVSYDENNPPDIQCVCDGEIHDIFTGPDPESTSTGMYVTVKCDSIFHADPAWSNIYTAYRHLDSIDVNLDIGDPINKGDFVGVMGASGFTSTVHLHFSVIRRNTGSNINVHPMRIFDPTDIPHLVDHLTTAEITQLSHTATEALFRIAIPYNRVNIRAIEVTLSGTGYSKIYDFETISQLPEEERDDNDAVEGLELFAYPLNRGHHLYRRVWDRIEDDQIPAAYPASPDNGAGNFDPYLSEGLHRTPAYGMDLRVKDLPNNFDITDLNIKIIDIWGYGVQANGQTQAMDEHFAWSMIDAEEQDAEEYETGTISLTSPDLDLVFDAGHGNQIVGLRFDSLLLPKNAVISDAWVHFRADDTNSDATDIAIHGEDSANSQPFTTTSNDLSDRTLTSDSVTWQPVPWTIDDMNDDQKWTGLSPIVQELVDRNDWTTDSPLTFLISGTGKREAEGYSATSLWKNAYVYVEYEEVGMLPIDLVYFAGQVKTTTNLIEWATASQHQTAWMVVERSPTGSDQWIEIGRLEGEETSNTTKTYTIEDGQPLLTGYYRLKTIDTDGSVDWSKTIVLHRTLNTFDHLICSPNPAKDQLSIFFSSSTKHRINLQLINGMGQIQQMDYIDPIVGMNAFEIDMRHLKQGLYFLVLEQQGQRVLQRVVKME